MTQIPRSLAEPWVEMMWTNEKNEMHQLAFAETATLAKIDDCGDPSKKMSFDAMMGLLKHVYRIVDENADNFLFSGKRQYFDHLTILFGDKFKWSFRSYKTENEIWDAEDPRWTPYDKKVGLLRNSASSKPDARVHARFAASGAIIEGIVKNVRVSDY